MLVGRIRLTLLGAATSFFVAGGVVLAQTALPQITVTVRAKPKMPAKLNKRPRPAAKPSLVQPSTRQAAREVGRSPGATTRTAGDGTQGTGGSGEPGREASATPAQRAEAEAEAQRARLLPKTGANSTTITKQDVDNLPAGDNTDFDQVLLQLPGVTQDTAGSGDFHIRNEHANAQFRINGIFLPEGVSGFSQVLDSSFISSIALVDGALPAQYGLRTAGIIDIQTRTGADNPGGTASIFGGAHGTIIPTISYSGTAGRWDYFFTGRYETSDIGVENPTPSHDAIHDRTRQGRYFGYVSGLLEDSSRVTFMSGASTAKYQIPNSPGVAPAFTAFGVGDFDSSQLNENQVEHSIFNVLAWQKSFGPLDSQLSYFQRYSTLHFIPDTVGDLVFNGVASDVTRTSLVNGLQNDNAYRLNGANTVRFGFITDVERAQSVNLNTVEPLDADGNPVDAPFSLFDAERKTGYVAGVYASDEVKLGSQVTVNAGVRFDYLHQYINSDQLSPRLGLDYRPVADTLIHAGYARTFTPPELALSAPSPVAQFDNTTNAADQDVSSPVKPERAHIFDLGVTQRVLPGLDLGLDGYYKIAKNLLDDGQFGQALVLTAFNYDHAFNQGVEFKANYVKGGFRAYGNLAVAQQKAKQVSSNQYLFGADELAFIANNYIFTDHAQIITVSAGASYRFDRTTISTDVLYGSGLRDGFANTGTVSPHAVVNLGLAQDFILFSPTKPTTLRFTVVNVLDNPYLIRDGSGIGVFAAQYGQRRGFFGGLSQRF